MNSTTTVPEILLMHCEIGDLEPYSIIMAYVLLDSLRLAATCPTPNKHDLCIVLCMLHSNGGGLIFDGKGSERYKVNKVCLPVSHGRRHVCVGRDVPVSLRIV